MTADLGQMRKGGGSLLADFFFFPIHLSCHFLVNPSHERISDTRLLAYSSLYDPSYIGHRQSLKLHLARDALYRRGGV
jgi:hypothetical protein